jgi:glucose/arabinose dehydrogenase
MVRSTVAVAFVASVVALAGAGAASTSSTDDWMQDRPGRTHRIDLAQLPPPYATKPASNGARVVPKPADARLEVPVGFKVELYAGGLGSSAILRKVEHLAGALAAPRTLRLAPNGDLFVAETGAGRIVALHRGDADAKLGRSSTFARGLLNPSGMQFYPRSQPQWLYVAETNRVVRYRYRAGNLAASAAPEIVVARLAASASGAHVTRDLVFSRDERRMFVSVGSDSDGAEDMATKSVADAQAWEATHALGAAWGDETNRADVLMFDVNADGGVSATGRIYATGLRNCAGLTIQPTTDELWCTVNERDMLGDDLVPDYSTRVRDGGFYGWPWYYSGDHQDPRHKGQRPDLAGKVLIPDVPYQSHSAPLSLLFYSEIHSAAAFPASYVGDGFAVLHGSWNRQNRTGYKVVRVRMKDGVPTGEYEDFLVGFISNASEVWGRPVDVLEDRDGALLISDDAGDAIYRISYAR